MAGTLRKAMGRGAKEADAAKRVQPESEASQASARSAALRVQIALAAFAISAYVRSTLCPALQGYTPQPVYPTSLVSVTGGKGSCGFEPVMLLSLTIALCKGVCTEMQPSCTSSCWQPLLSV